MVCPRCNRPVDNGATFCGNCGNQITPALAPGATELVSRASNPYQTAGGPTIVVPPTQDSLPSMGQQSYDSISPLAQRGMPHPCPPDGGVTPLPGSSFTPPPAPAQPQLAAKPAARPARPPRRRNAFIIAIIALLIIGLSAGLATLLQTNSIPSASQSASTTAAGSPTYQVSFSSSPEAQTQGFTDTVTMNIGGLPAPAQGMQYDAWLVNTQQEQTTPLGKFTPQGQGFSLTYTDPMQNLLGLGNTILVTQEQNNATLPTGKALFTAQFPTMAFIHIGHILIAFPTTPGHTGLLLGLLNQAHQAEAQAILLNGLAGNRSPTAVTCAAQNLINILEGQHGQHYKPLPAQCAGLNATVSGDGFGLLGSDGYISLAGQHASLAAQAGDAANNIKLHAGLVETSLANVTNWMTTVDNDAQSLLSHPNDTGKMQEIEALTERAITGVDLNNDGRVDPVAGEAGMQVAIQQAQLMAQLSLQKA